MPAAKSKKNKNSRCLKLKLSCSRRKPKSALRKKKVSREKQVRFSRKLVSKHKGAPNKSKRMLKKKAPLRLILSPAPRRINRKANSNKKRF